MQLYIHYIHVEIHCQEATSVDMLLMYIIIPLLKYKTT